MLREFAEVPEVLVSDAQDKEGHKVSKSVGTDAFKAKRAR